MVVDVCAHEADSQIKKKIGLMTGRDSKIVFVSEDAAV